MINGFLMLTAVQAQELGLEVDYGAILVSGSFLTEPAIYPNGPADEAGLIENDIILEVEGQELSSKNSLKNILRDFKVGDIISLKIWRAGEAMEINVVLGDSSSYIE